MDFSRHDNTIINKKLKYIMGFNDFLKKIFGNKSQRDLREIQPIVAEINKIYPTLENLSNDELRDRITKIRAALKDSVADKRKEIADIKAEIENVEYENREPYWEKIDKIEKDILEVLEDELNKYLPEVFAIVRDTARRFAQNESIEVTASDFDRELAAQGKDFIEINDDKAIYHNHWMAGGNEVTWDMIHYDVQLIGGIVLHQGKIAEMATGEGKTLVATLPVFLNALTGNGVHMVTVNDYLAKRDSEWMGPLYMFHGLSVDCIDKTEPNSPERRRAYNADITFGTNNEFGFDYLRDNMATSPADLVQRPHNFAIVDEVDSVLIDDARTPLIIGRLRSAQLPVNINHGLLLGVARVFLQRIVDDREVDAREVLLVQQNRLGAAFEDLVHMLLLENRLAVHDHVVSFDGNHLARVLVHEVLDPRREHPRGQLAAHGLLEVGLVDLHLVRQVEDFQDLLVGLVADGAQQRRDGQFLLTVDVRIHHVVDVRSELDPRTLERNDSRRVELGAVRVHALSEEHAGRTVQLGYDDTLRTVDDERTAFGHIGDRTEVHVLNDNTEIFVFVVRAVELQLGFQRNAVRQTALQALLDRVTGRVDIVVDKLQNEIVPGIRDGEIFLEDLVEALVLTVFGRGVHLEKVPE